MSESNEKANKPKNPIFAKIARAKASLGGNHIRDGIYAFTVRNIMCEAKESGTCFIVELLVDKSQSQGDVWSKGGNPVWEQVEGAIAVQANPVGSTPSMVCVLDKGNKSAMGNVVAFVCALLGEDPSVVEQDPDDFACAIEELCSKEQPGRGMRILAETYRKKIKGGDNAGKPFVRTRWEHAPMTDDEIAARRSELDRSQAAEKQAAA